MLDEMQPANNDKRDATGKESEIDKTILSPIRGPNQLKSQRTCKSAEKYLISLSFHRHSNPHVFRYVYGRTHFSPRKGFLFRLEMHGDEEINQTEPGIELVISFASFRE